MAIKLLMPEEMKIKAALLNLPLPLPKSVVTLSQYDYEQIRQILTVLQEAIDNE